MRYQLTNNPILLPYQQKILQLFFAADFGKTFFLTGGTALAAFYFAHRESKDFDFFSLEIFRAEALNQAIKEIAGKMKAQVSIKIAGETYNEIYLENKQERWIQRIDIVREQPIHFGQIEIVDGVRVDSLENIGSNKVLAIYGRFEPKDFVDLFWIIKNTDWDFKTLFELARKKDRGLFEFYWANVISLLEKLETLPKMRKSIKLQLLKNFYLGLQKKLLLEVKPQD